MGMVKRGAGERDMGQVQLPDILGLFVGLNLKLARALQYFRYRHFLVSLRILYQILPEENYKKKIKNPGLVII
jgi:hypothetical protein